ncbi:hypothetical protein HK101_005387 [Irineochytrium annulatum]|nr:hypothetical protein HK101_005387 [Irineochytrium annulatum]
MLARNYPLLSPSNFVKPHPLLPVNANAPSNPPGRASRIENRLGPGRRDNRNNRFEDTTRVEPNCIDARGAACAPPRIIIPDIWESDEVLSEDGFYGIPSAAPDPADNRLPRTILVAVDHTPESQEALAYALENVVRRNDEVRLCTLERRGGGGPTWTDQLRSLLPGGMGGKSLDRVKEERAEVAMEAAKEAIREAWCTIVRHRSNLEPRDVYHVKHEVVLASEEEMWKAEGGVVEFIRDMCVRGSKKADMLVVGSSGGLGRRWGDTVSDHLSRSAPCPVLIVKRYHADVVKLDGDFADSDENDGDVPLPSSVERIAEVENALKEGFGISGMVTAFDRVAEGMGSTEVEKNLAEGPNAFGMSGRIMALPGVAEATLGV